MTQTIEAERTVTLEEFLSAMKKARIKTQIEKIADGRIKVAYYKGASLQCHYFYPQNYTTKISARYTLIEGLLANAMRTSKKLNNKGKTQSLKKKRVLKVDQHVVFRACKFLKPSQVTEVFQISSVYATYIKQKGTELKW